MGGEIEAEDRAEKRIGRQQLSIRAEQQNGAAAGIKGSFQLRGQYREIFPAGRQIMGALVHQVLQLIPVLLQFPDHLIEGGSQRYHFGRPTLGQPGFKVAGRHFAGRIGRIADVAGQTPTPEQAEQGTE